MYQQKQTNKKHIIILFFNTRLARIFTFFFFFFEVIAFTVVVLKNILAPQNATLSILVLPPHFTIHLTLNTLFFILHLK